MAKELGNQQFKLKNFDKAIEHYTEAITANPGDHTIYGNRSASYHNLKRYAEALADAEKCIQIKPDWSKGFQRKAMALHGQGDVDGAMTAYSKGLELDPNNAQIRQGMANIQQEMQAQMGGMGGMGNMFGGPQAEAKLKANPRIAKYFEDPQFNNMWQMCQQNPQMLMQLI